VKKTGVPATTAGAKLMERTMTRFISLILAALFGGADHVAAQEKVEATGITSAVKLEEVVFGHLHDLNGKFKLRATEVTFAPGAYLGVHHHIGPGIRYVLSGQVTFTEGGRATIYQAGEYFYEAGNIAHTAENKTDSLLRILFVEIVPATWESPTVIPPKSY
jgi:quercetin dioxygenase-like cupin family protein